MITQTRGPVNENGIDVVYDQSHNVVRQVHAPMFKEIKQLSVPAARTDMREWWEFFERMLSSVLGIASTAFGGSSHQRTEMHAYSAYAYASLGAKGRLSEYEQMVREWYITIHGDMLADMQDKFIDAFKERQQEIIDTKKAEIVMKESVKAIT